MPKLAEAIGAAYQWGGTNPDNILMEAFILTYALDNNMIGIVNNFLHDDYTLYSVIDGSFFFNWEPILETAYAYWKEEGLDKKRVEKILSLLRGANMESQSREKKIFDKASQLSDSTSQASKKSYYARYFSWIIDWLRSKA